MDRTGERVLLVPGLYNSGPDHWQSRWEREFGFDRLQQTDWETPRCEDWVTGLHAALTTSDAPTVLVAHSLGAILVAHWAAFADPLVVGRIASAMLVAPSDAERADFPPGAVGFSPIPLEQLPFRSMVVASTDDRYTTPERAATLAACWGSERVDIGPCGHITTADGFGAWPEGLRLLERLRGSG